MRKFAFFIIIFNLLIFVFFACHSEEDDFEPPRINVGNTSFKDGDTLFVSSYKLNLFQADLTDNEGLSTMKIKIRFTGTTEKDSFEYYKNTAGEDSAIFNVALINKVYLFNINGEKSTIVNDSFNILRDQQYRPAGYTISRPFPVKAGKWYELILGCIDRAGNYDSIVYKDITILYPDSITPEN